MCKRLRLFKGSGSGPERAWEKEQLSFKWELLLISACTVFGSLF